jgi:hypothetical protein
MGKVLQAQRLVWGKESPKFRDGFAKAYLMYSRWGWEGAEAFMEPTEPEMCSCLVIIAFVSGLCVF